MRKINIKLLFKRKALPVLWAENFLSTPEALDPPDHFHFNSTTSVRAEVGLGCLVMRALCEIVKTYRTKGTSFLMERGQLQPFFGIRCYMNGSCSCLYRVPFHEVSFFILLGVIVPCEMYFVVSCMKGSNVQREALSLGQSRGLVRL